jgi:hypothetical protein
MHTAQLSLDAPPPATRVSATSVFHRPKRAAPTALTALTPAMGRPSGTRDWHSGSGNCGNPYRRPAPAPPGIPHQATAERWVRWWAGIAISATSGVFTALYAGKWRRGCPTKSRIVQKIPKIIYNAPFRCRPRTPKAVAVGRGHVVHLRAARAREWAKRLMVPQSRVAFTQGVCESALDDRFVFNKHSSQVSDTARFSRRCALLLV